MSRDIADETAIAAAGYPAVREALNKALAACVEKVKKADFLMAQEVLEVDVPDAASEVLLIDTALYSRPGDPVVRSARKRAVDRIVPKLRIKGDPLAASVAARLPEAFFSVFEAVRPHPAGGILVKDLLDEGRSLHVMDDALADTAEPGTLFAGRFVDLGPWLAGFGIVITLRKSEAAAIIIALSHEGEVAEKRDALHELVYLGQIYGADLVPLALEPLISIMALMIDQTDIEVAEVVAGFRSAMGSAGQEPEEP